MKILNLFIIYLNFLVGNLIFCLNRKHLIIMLLMLEFMALSMLVLLMIFLMNYSLDYYFLMLFLILTVCEGVLGLSILVFMIRLFGNDYFYVSSIL
uniref:NADH-ubiquinone oxidoreductase chain 4L n=1 Tax=Psilotreta sp. XG-2021 TaxID=2996739 RepID=A0A9E8LP93_9NEOP|nr:NADH dehydrogenase subunit 4L [Psilotreta sp. XG-2021]